VSEDQVLRLTYLGIWLAVLLPAVILHRRRGGRLWRDIALWTAVAGAAVLAYLMLDP
jgi:predicted aspartyl protease